MALPTLATEFYLVTDPELRFTPGGAAVGRLRLKASSRKKQGDEWVDDKVLWLSATVFGDLAEHCMETLKKGDLVVVTGRLTTEEWNTKEGEKRSAVVLLVDSVGPSLRFRTWPHGSTPQDAPATHGQRSSAASNTSAQEEEPPF